MYVFRAAGFLVPGTLTSVQFAAAALQVCGARTSGGHRAPLGVSSRLRSAIGGRGEGFYAPFPALPDPIKNFMQLVATLGEHRLKARIGVKHGGQSHWHDR